MKNVLTVRTTGLERRLMNSVPSWTSKAARLLVQSRAITAKNKRIMDLEKTVKTQQYIIDKQRNELEQKAPQRRAITEAEKHFKR